MKSIIIAPRRYVQGKNVLAEAGTYVAMLGKKALTPWDPVVKGLIGDTLLRSLEEAGVEAVPVARTVYPARESAWFTTVRMAASSSATRIVPLAITLPLQFLRRQARYRPYARHGTWAGEYGNWFVPSCSRNRSRRHGHR